MGPDQGKRHLTAGRGRIIGNARLVPRFLSAGRNATGYDHVRCRSGGARQGDAIVGDPIAAMEQLYRLDQVKPARSATRTTRPAASSAASGKITVKQFNDVLAQASPPDAAFTSEAFSLGSRWEQFPSPAPRASSVAQLAHSVLPCRLRWGRAWHLENGL